MRYRTAAAWLILPALMLCLTGCGDSKAAKEARLQGITRMNEGNYSEAIESFDQALEHGDGIVNNFELDILRYRGEAEFALKDYTAAVHTYEILVDVDKAQPEDLYCGAAAKALSGNLEAAVSDYKVADGIDERAGRHVSGAALAISSIGRAYIENGDTETAMSFFKEAVNIGKVDVDIFNQMGICMISAKQYDEAIGYFDQGLTMADETQAKALFYNRVAAYEYKGDFERAGQLLREYEAVYGSDLETTKELTFIESRQ